MRDRALAVVGLFLGLLAVLPTPDGARAANLRNHIEAVRRNAPIVYLGVVGDIELSEQGPRSQLEARATVRVLFVARSATGKTPSATTLEYSTWDDEHPPHDGDGQHRLDPGSLVVVFAVSWSGGPTPYLLKGSREEILSDLASRRDDLAGMSDEALELHEIDEADRRVQLRLYGRLVSHLESLADGMP